MAHDQDPDYVLALAGTFLALCPIFAALRFYNRHLQKAGFGMDDWLVIPATLLNIGCAISLIVGVRMMILGYPVTVAQQLHVAPDVPYKLSMKLEFAIFFMQILAVGCTKLSFILFFRRIFVIQRFREPFNIASIVVAALVSLWTVALTLWIILACGSDVAVRWSDLLKFRTTCPTYDKGLLAYAISDFLTDLMVFILPIPMVLRLHMKPRRKFAILAVFAFGSLAVVASIIRLAIWSYITRAAASNTSNLHVDNDLLTTRGLYWSMLESGIAVIACSLPTLNTFVRVKAISGVMRKVYSLSTMRRPLQPSDGESGKHGSPRRQVSDSGESGQKTPSVGPGPEHKTETLSDDLGARGSDISRETP